MGNEAEQDFNDRWDDRFEEKMEVVGFNVRTQEGRETTHKNNKWVDEQRRKGEKRKEAVKTLIVTLIGMAATSAFTASLPHILPALKAFFR